MDAETYKAAESIAKFHEALMRSLVKTGAITEAQAISALKSGMEALYSSKSGVTAAFDTVFSKENGFREP